MSEGQAVAPRIVERSDVDLDGLVARLNAISRGTKLHHVLEIGTVVVQEIYGGDLEALRARGRKDASFRRLTEHPGLEMSRGTLWRAVGAYEIMKRLPGIIRNPNISVAHLYAVVGLDPEIQERLLRLAEAERWSSRQLADRARAHKNGQASQPATGNAAPERRAVRRLERLAREGDLLISSWDHLHPSERLRAERALEQIQTACARKLAELKRSAGKQPLPEA